ncbi:MAG: sugar ABC transporter permease [Nodularia sp. (in: Bacteria)]|nr:MAG: sugar ABC transporter permease [Nodularia sp. (in: cyanobacteria)]
MVNTYNVQVTISLTELGLDDEDLQRKVQNLLPQLKKVDGVEDAGLVAEENAPQGTRSISGYVWGLLKAQVNPAHIKTLFKFLSDRFGNKRLKLDLEAADGRKLHVEVSNAQELELAIQKAQDFLNNTSNS